MPNMSYCRFINTLRDLEDCYRHADDSDLSYDEYRARHKLIELCIRIGDDYAFEVEQELPSREAYEQQQRETET